MTIWSDGRVTTRPFGVSNGMTLSAETYVGTDGKTYVRFPFEIDGI